MKIFLLFSPIFIVAGCSNLKHAVVFEDTVIGADLATDPKDASIRAVFGYERQTDAAIPKSCINTKGNASNESNGSNASKAIADDAPCEIEALSVLLNSKVKMDWFHETSIQQSFSTGNAAINIARNPALMKPFISPSQTAGKAAGQAAAGQTNKE